jgi:predicted CoA-binding protein
MTTTTARPVDERLARDFLDAGRLVVIGASPERDSFGGTIARALHAHGTEVVVVNRGNRPVDDLPCYRSIDTVPGEVDGVIVVVPPAVAANVVRECAAAGVRRIWLFKGIGGPGSATDEAVAVAEASDMEVIAGACPLMFIEPVGWFHRVHRYVRRHRETLT